MFIGLPIASSASPIVPLLGGQFIQEARNCYQLWLPAGRFPLAPFVVYIRPG